MTRSLLLSTLQKSKPRLSLQPAALVGVYEHCLSAEGSSPMVSMAMTLPAGSKFSCGEGDCGQIASAYKHAILQGNENESKISLARKADLRPSPISSILSPDLLTIQSSFHLNYLPDILKTFKGFLDYGVDGVEDWDVEDRIKGAVLLDGQLGHGDSRVILLEAARRAAFKANNLYFSSPNSLSPINSDSIKSFHQNTINRISEKNQQFSLLLSVNNSKLIGLNEFKDVLKECNFSINSETPVNDDQSIKPINQSNFINLEMDHSRWNEYLLAFPIPEGGFNQKNSQLSLILESILKKSFPSTEASVTSDTSILTIYFKFDSKTSSNEIKSKMQNIVKELKDLCTSVKDENITWAHERSKFNQALANDSRSNRLLLFSHHFAFTGHLPNHPENPPSMESVKEALKNLIIEGNPILIGRGNWKKLINYKELF